MESQVILEGLKRSLDKHSQMRKLHQEEEAQKVAVLIEWQKQKRQERLKVEEEIDMKLAVLKHWRGASGAGCANGRYSEEAKGADKPHAEKSKRPVILAARKVPAEKAGVDYYEMRKVARMITAETD